MLLKIFIKHLSPPHFKCGEFEHTQIFFFSLFCFAFHYCPQLSKQDSLETRYTSCEFKMCVSIKGNTFTWNWRIQVKQHTVKNLRVGHDTLQCWTRYLKNYTRLKSFVDAYSEIRKMSKMKLFTKICHQPFIH